MLTLGGRTCVFAGGSGAVGRGAVRALAEGGMNVVLVTHNPARAAGAVQEMADLPGRVIAMDNDRPEPELFAAVARQFGSVDVAISSIGNLMAPTPLETLSAAELQERLDHQITQVFAYMQAALPYIRQSRAGRMIFTTTAGARDGFPCENALDSIARGGVAAMTCCFARALAGSGATANCIARSGLINDHPPRNASELDTAAFAEKIPIGRVGTAAEYGALVAYLASEESGFTTGQILELSGGIRMG